MTKSTEFGILLTDAIYRISSCEADKPLSVIHDELGYALERESGSAIYYWRRGNVPKLNDVEKLTKVIIQRSNLGKEWVRSFLESAEHPYVGGICNELFPKQLGTSSLGERTDKEAGGPAGIQKHNFNKSQLSHTGLPKRRHSQLVGHAHLLEEVIGVLADPHAQWIISIDGIGGIGKTALAYEIAAVAIKKQLFERVIWIDADIKQKKEENKEFSFEDVLNCIANQLGETATVQLPMPEKEARIQSLLETQKVLLLVDSLENAIEVQADISRKLYNLLGISKALLVSRYRFKGDIYAIHLSGLTIQDAVQFIRSEAKKQRMKRVEGATYEELESIAISTGGSPLAIKLVLGQLKHLPIGIVLKQLQKAKPVNHDIENDEYFYLYSNIYAPHWEQVSEAGQELLYSIIQLESNTDISLDMLRTACRGFTDDDLARCINELWHFSFMDTSECTSASLGQVKYNLHALTRYFVPSSDIILL